MFRKSLFLSLVFIVFCSSFSVLAVDSPIYVSEYDIQPLVRKWDFISTYDNEYISDIRTSEFLYFRNGRFITPSSNIQLYCYAYSVNDSYNPSSESPVSYSSSSNINCYSFPDIPSVVTSNDQFYPTILNGFYLCSLETTFSFFSFIGGGSGSGTLFTDVTSITTVPIIYYSESIDGVYKPLIVQSSSTSNGGIYSFLSCDLSTCPSTQITRLNNPFYDSSVEPPTGGGDNPPSTGDGDGGWWSQTLTSLVLQSDMTTGIPSGRNNYEGLLQQIMYAPMYALLGTNEYRFFQQVSGDGGISYRLSSPQSGSFADALLNWMQFAPLAASGYSYLLEFGSDGLQVSQGVYSQDYSLIHSLYALGLALRDGLNPTPVPDVVQDDFTASSSDFSDASSVQDGLKGLLDTDVSSGDFFNAVSGSAPWEWFSQSVADSLDTVSGVTTYSLSDPVHWVLDNDYFNRKRFVGSG